MGDIFVTLVLSCRLPSVMTPHLLECGMRRTTRGKKGKSEGLVVPRVTNNIVYLYLYWAHVTYYSYSSMECRV